MYNVTSIKNYILFLKKQCGLMITLHPIKEEPLIFSSELINFNLHDNPYCIYIKSFPHVYHHCIERQNKVFDKCKGGSFCGCCFSGCMEFVYPISNGNETVGFISVNLRVYHAAYCNLLGLHCSIHSFHQRKPLKCRA